MLKWLVTYHSTKQSYQSRRAKTSWATLTNSTIRQQKLSKQTTPRTILEKSPVKLSESEYTRGEPETYGKAT